MSDITQFIREELYPRLFDRIDIVFPSLRFTRYMGGWRSPLKMDGNDPKKPRIDKTKITRNVQHRALEQGGGSKDLITLYADLNGLSHEHGDIAATKAIASIIGLQMPTQVDCEKNRLWREKQEKLEALATNMEKDLYTEEGKRVLEYLKNTRLYDSQFIEFASFGYCSEQTAKELRPLFEYTTSTGTKNYLPYGTGTTHILSLPYRCNGEIKGFVFRSITTNISQKKYKDAFVEETTKVGTTRQASNDLHLFGLTTLSRIENEEWNKTIVVVEGEIDALRASFVGIPNVVAASGGTIGEEALQEAKRMGATGVTILFDTEETAEHALTEKGFEASLYGKIKNLCIDYSKTYNIEERKTIKENGVKILTGHGISSEDASEFWEVSAKATKTQSDITDKINKAIKLVRNNNLTPYVAVLPQEQDGAKVDVDSYLRTHTGDELKKIVNFPYTASLWRMERLANELESQATDGSYSLPYAEELKRRTIQLANSSLTKATDRDVIFGRYSELTGKTITKEAIAEEADRLKGIEDAKRKKSETLTTLSEAYQTANSTSEDGVEQALRFLKKRLPLLQQISKSREFAKLLLLPTTEGIRAKLKERPKGIATNFQFGDGDRAERFVLPSGALTYICAPTSHGKSRMLQNLALQLCYGNDGAILYFTFEEDAEAVKIQLLNTYIGQSLSKNNLRSLNDYYTTGKNYFYRDSGTQQTFKQKEAEFMALLTSGKLRVFYEDYDSTELIEAIRYISKEIRVKAVFVDYIQLLHAKGSKLQRKDELKQICKDLMNLSIEIKAPVVLAAQLNREALSPVEMAVQNIAEASDIEHSANIVMLLWNSNVKPLPKSNGYFQDRGKGEKLSKDAQRIADKGFSIGTDGKIYAILAKNRGGARNIDAVFDCNSNTGTITQPSFKAEPVQDNSLPFAPTEDNDPNIF